MIINYREDTIHITNAAFVIIASLSAISFSFARTIDSKELSDRVTFAGERFLHGAILVLTASIIKYFIFIVLKISYFENTMWASTTLTLTIGVLASVVFLNGVMFAHTGLRVLNDLLLSRMTRHKDWDNMW